MFFRSQRKTQNETFISDPIDVDDDGNSLTYMDIVCQEDDIADCIDLKNKHKTSVFIHQGSAGTRKNDNNHALRSL